MFCSQVPLSRPGGSPQKGVNKEYKFFPQFVLESVGFKNLGCWLFPGVLEGLGSSGKLVRTISTYPGTCKCPGLRGIAKNPALYNIVR